MIGCRVWHGLVIGVAIVLTMLMPSVSEAQCSVSSSGVAFGAYDVLAPAPVDVTGTVTFSCLLALFPRITLSTGSSGTFVARTMKKGPESLTYNLYTDAARTVIWGDGTSGTGQYAPLLLLLGGTLTVYARLPASQNVSAGAYSDTVIVTLFF